MMVRLAICIEFLIQPDYLRSAANHQVYVDTKGEVYDG